MFEHEDLQMFDLQLAKYEYFSRNEVVDQGRETQFQKYEKINY